MNQEDDGDAAEVSMAVRDGVGSIFKGRPAESSLLGSLMKVMREAVFGSRA